MRIVFYGGKQAGAVGLLALAAAGNSVQFVFAEDEPVRLVAAALGVPSSGPEKINSEKTEAAIRKLRPDLFVCVHGRKIVGQKVLSIPGHGGINAHPCLSKYPGASPVERLLADGGRTASVGVHRMTDKVDAGEVLEELFVDVSDCKTVVEVYNRLYPYYAAAILSAVKKLEKSR